MSTSQELRLAIGGATTCALVLVQGDITQETTDAIVNAANSELAPGGGVCGAIHRAGGPQIAEECRRVRAQRGPVAPGSAAATSAGCLPAQHVIHAVGPVWSGGSNAEPETLASCYRESIRIADEMGLGSIAFPAISTGIFGYPVDKATEVAVGTVAEALPKMKSLHTVRFVVFDERTYAAYAEALEALRKAKPAWRAEAPSRKQPA